MILLFQFQVAVVGNSLFAVGGYNGTNYLSSIERLDLMNKSWMKVKHMLVDPTSVAVSYKERIFMISTYSKVKLIFNDRCLAVINFIITI